MKVLIVCDKNSYINPYVTTLAESLQDHKIEVTCSIKEFWTNPLSYDVIHIQWPNLLVKEMGYDGSKLNDIFDSLQKKQIPIVVTLHNLAPHYSTEKKILLAYNIVFKRANCIIHLGEASIEPFNIQNPNNIAKHVVIPHHTYDNLYSMNITKNEARKQLGIAEGKKCVLCFGSFRNDEERKLVSQLSDNLDSNYIILAPGFFRDVIFRKNIFKATIALFKTIKYSIIAKLHHIKISHKYISDNEVPFFMAAADVLLVQRIKILNSGNVPLAMFSGLPIVGPNIGNVGWMLKKTKNFTFEISDQSKIANLIKIAADSQSLGTANKEFAKKNLSSSIVAKKLINTYESLRVAR